MLDLPDAPFIDKQSLVGGCVRLGLRVDAERLAADVGALPQEAWATTGGRVGVHNAANAVFLRGFAPAEGNLPIEERPPLRQMPYVRSIVYDLIPAPVLRCLLARLPAGAAIAPHVDRAPYFGKTIRIHVPVVTHDKAWMYCAGQVYRMAPAEVWALNNSTVHAVWNQHPTLARTHLICDFLPSPGLAALLASGERELGQPRPEVEAHLATLSAGTRQ